MRYGSALALEKPGRMDGAFNSARWAEQRYSALGAEAAERLATTAALVRRLANGVH